MTRWYFVVAWLVGSTAAARADGMLPQGADITFDKIFIHEDGGDLKEPSEPDAIHRYFNLAHCICSQSALGMQQGFAYELSTKIDTQRSLAVEIWVGTSCNDSMRRDGGADDCVQSDSIADVDNLLTPEKVDISVFDAVNVKNPSPCKTAVVTTLAWAMVDVDGNGEFEYWKTQEIPKVGTLVDAKIDTEPPMLPQDFSASGGENSVEIRWEIPEGREDDYFVFQALCSNVDDTVAKTEALPERKYETPSSLCGASLALDLVRSELPENDTDAPVSELPPQFGAVDEAFLCGEQTNATATSLTISGLTNGTPYKVALLAIDRAGNVAGTYFSRTVTPKPVIDFWEDLNDRNGGIEGGCLLAQTYGDGSPLTRGLRAFRDDTLAKTAFGRWLIDVYYASIGKLGVHGGLRVLAAILLAPLVLIALAWHALTLPGLLLLVAAPWLWRRFRRHVPRVPIARLAPVAVLALVVAAPGLAAADDFTPYWEDPSNEDASTDDVKWHAGIRLGPYIPEIDLQVGLNATTGVGPYAAMFGDYTIGDTEHEQKVYQILPMLDVDRVLWSGFGQITVGGMIGYMQKSAYAYLDGTHEDQQWRQRSPSSKNTFRLIPFAATAGYRFTYLDDRWGIPVVPYVKGGLSYYAWWMTAPNGDTAKVCDDTTMSMCDTARGGSLGYQGSIGLAIRAERIDSSAAMSMRNSGILHAGFYAELYWAKVDGFGSSTRLSVGDTTWFAGVDFEF